MSAAPRRLSSLGRVLLASVGLAALAGPLAAPALATPAQDPAPPTTAPVAVASGALQGEEAIGDLAGCIQGSKRLAVVFLIDQSGSLGKSDPENRRVDAARAALDSLVSLTEGPQEERARVDVTVAAFSNDYYAIRPWTTVNDTTRGRLNRTLEGFRKRNQGTDTDFVNALTGARAALADRSAQLTADGSAEPCKAIVLFTDGQYDIGVRDPSNSEELGTTKPYAPGVTLDAEEGALAAEAAGRAALCDEGGLADGVRDDDITLLSVALTGTVTAQDQNLLAAVSTGSSGPVTCGRPTETAPGAYVSAADVDILVARFDEVATRVAGGTIVPEEGQVLLCGTEPCPEGTRTIKVDESVRRFRVFALASEPGMTVELSSPTGSAVVEEAGRFSVASASASAHAIAGRGFSIDVDRPDDAADWTGTWTVILRDSTGDNVGEPVTFAHYLFTDVGIDFTEGPAPMIVRGEGVGISASPVIPEALGAKLASAKVVLRLDDPLSSTSTNVELVGPANGPYIAEFTAPLDYRSSSYEATIALEGTTESGAVVSARSAPRLLTVQRPAGAIQFVPASLQMPTLTGTGVTSAELIVLGGAKDGCLWFGPSRTITAPDAAGELKVTYQGEAAVDEDSCIPVKAKATVTIPVEISPSSRATGAVRGVIEVNEKTDGTEPTVTDVPYRLDLAAGVDEEQRVLLAVLLLLGGLLLPVILLVIINALTARFQDLDAVRGGVIPVRVDGERMWRTDGGRMATLMFAPSDFQSLADAGDPRRFTFGGIVFRARPSRNPFGASLALAAPEGGAEKLKGGAGSRVELDLGLAGSWVFLLDPDRTRQAGRTGIAEGRIIAFVSEGDPAAQISRITEDVYARLPRTAAGLAGLVMQKRPKAKKGRSSGGDAEAEVDDTGDIDEVGAVDVDPGTTEAPTAAVDVDAPFVVDGSGEVAPATPAPPPPPPMSDAVAWSVSAADEAIPMPSVVDEPIAMPASSDAPADPAPSDPEPDEPAAPVGFGGRPAAVDPASVAPPVDDDPGPDDDAPPVGFTGGAPG